MPTHPRAEELIDTLHLTPHPEGGWFAEVFRSERVVSPSDARGERSALTAIYFLLVEGSASRWHRVASDEVWHHCEGAPVELLIAPPEGGSVLRITLGPLSDASSPMCVVPAGWWQAARPLGPYSLVACCVGPGFDFAEFTMLADLPDAERPTIAPRELLNELL